MKLASIPTHIVCLIDFHSILEDLRYVIIIPLESYADKQGRQVASTEKIYKRGPEDYTRCWYAGAKMLCTVHTSTGLCKEKMRNGQSG